ncbi:MAG: tetratricopeptide repeat protein [Candidatus Promineifilaceae bacterium]|nr:tetratricopeptide repeat protein [Candidatus Promineifilaceae bacterium]
MISQTKYMEGDLIGDRYLVHQALKGGMGEVYLCLDEEKQYPYALKTFKSRYLMKTPAQMKAFEQEILTWVKLEKHPNIVRCYYMKTLDKQPFMFLEWILGEAGLGADLRSWLSRGPLELRTAMDFAIDICRGLVHAQLRQPGIVHRDIKPENVLIAQGRLAKVTDFGVAQIVAEARLSEAKTPVVPESEQHMNVSPEKVAGTPPYMPPEQWHPNVKLDERTDIYALGCVMFEMLSGRTPFAVDDPLTPEQKRNWYDNWQRQHENANIPALPGTVPSVIAEIIAQCLKRDRDTRPERLDELLLALELGYNQCFGITPRAISNPDQFSAIDYNNRGSTYLTLQKYTSALDDFNSAIELNKSHTSAYSNRGLVHRALKQYKKALDDFNQAINLNPDNASIYTNRGLVKIDLGLNDEALPDFDHAIRLDSQLAEAYSNRAGVYYAQGQYDKALADYAQAINLDPKDWYAYSGRGHTYADLEQYQAALADFNEAVQLDPYNAETYNNRGIIYQNLKLVKEALADYNQAMRLDPNESRAFYNRGNTFAELHQYRAALADYNRAIYIDPNYADAYYGRARTKRDIQQYDEALTDFNQAIELNPYFAEAYYSRGLLMETLQEYDAALADYQKAIEIDPTDPRSYVNTGKILGNRGEHQLALQYFEQAEEMGDELGAQNAIYARQKLREASLPSYNQVRMASEAFFNATSITDLREATENYPFMKNDNFITTIEKIVKNHASPETRADIEVMLALLQQIAKEEG